MLVKKSKVVDSEITILRSICKVIVQISQKRSIIDRLLKPLTFKKKIEVLTFEGEILNNFVYWTYNKKPVSFEDELFLNSLLEHCEKI